MMTEGHPIKEEEKVRILQKLKLVKGILDARIFHDSDRMKVRNIEEEAEKKSLLGLGKVINSGVEAVIVSDIIYVALTSMEFEWGHCSSLVLKKGDEIVGEEVRDPNRLELLKSRKNVWFMHRSFVVYKDKISFPQDIMQKVCYFEIPPIPCDWDPISDLKARYEFVFANPATPCDVYLKERYFDGLDERGLGTILIGVSVKKTNKEGGRDGNI